MLIVFGCLLVVVIQRDLFDVQSYDKDYGADLEVGRNSPGEYNADLHEFWPEAFWEELQWIWNEDSNSVRRTYKILYWTPQYKNPKWFGLGDTPFLEANCPIHQCETTNDTTTYSSCDAILIHQSALKTYELPKVKLNGQKWIIKLAESPVYGARNWTVYNGLFEGIIDYRLDADIPRFLGYFVRKAKKSETKKVDYTGGKNKRPPVAWFVSHCKTHSERERYADELQKHIDIDVYGRCGTKVCERSINDHSPTNDPCMDMLHKEYKFYLAFENSFCKDYMTEKIWLIYVHQMNIVPIVLGGANYSRYFPSHSYIDVLDFASPQHLAQHLHKLNQNDDLYNEYFAWRNKYYFKKVNTLACGLCSYLHKNAGETSIHNDLDKWKSRKEHCLDPKDYYRGRLASKGVDRGALI